MADSTTEPRKPDSLLFSLKELRQIEHHRISAEKAAQERLVQEQQVAAEKAAQQAREETKRQQRLERNRIEAAEREERLRLAESERRARVEAEMQLERERLKLELGAATKSNSDSNPWGTISVVLVVLLTGGLALTSYELHKHSGLQRISEQRRARLEQAQQKNSQSEMKLVLAQAQLRDQGTQIKLLQTSIFDLTTRAQSGVRPRAKKRSKKRSGTKQGSKPLINVEKCDLDDPICGIKGPK